MALPGTFGMCRSRSRSCGRRSSGLSSRRAQCCFSHNAPMIRCWGHPTSLCSAMNGCGTKAGVLAFSTQGGPDIGNSTGWTDGGQSAKIPDAIDACISNSDGFFAFDLCHVKKYDYWNAFKTGFDKYLESIEE